MSDDLVNAVARAIREAEPCAHGVDCWCLEARAAVAAIAAHGDVTDEDVYAALAAAMVTVSVLDDVNLTPLAPAVRALIAQAVATRDAHLARVLIESEQRRAAAERAVARAEAAEATVERVRYVAGNWISSDNIGLNVEVVLRSSLRAALDGDA
jgi:hypothetical protein